MNLVVVDGVSVSVPQAAFAEEGGDRAALVRDREEAIVPTRDMLHEAGANVNVRPADVTHWAVGGHHKLVDTRSSPPCVPADGPLAQRVWT